jgi:hypothetical protein
MGSMSLPSMIQRVHLSTQLAGALHHQVLRQGQMREHHGEGAGGVARLGSTKIAGSVAHSRATKIAHTEGSPFSSSRWCWPPRENPISDLGP